jgi:hypothetical protein
MPLTLLDFVQQVDNVTVDDIPDGTQDSINDELDQQTSGDGGNDDGITNPSDARIVADTVADLNGRAGFTSIQEAIDGEMEIMKPRLIPWQRMAPSSSNPARILNRSPSV